MKKQRFAPIDTLALSPKSFGTFFDSCEEKAPDGLTENGVAVVTIRGPLMHRKEWWFDSYDAIKERVAAATELSPKMIVLSIDSPGGLVSGAFDTARELRVMARTAGIDLYAHIDGQGTSAAYALATAATWIGVSQTAMVGSIGVIDMLLDATAQNAMMGLNVQLIASGERKTDGNPNSPISDDAVEASQVRVDALAEMFFALVTEHGWGESEDNLRAMQASIVHGEDAVRMGLASEIATLDQTIGFASPEELRSGTEADANTTEEKYEMAKVKANPIDDAIASLRKAAEGDDEEEAKRARAALKSLGAEDDDGDNDEDDDESSAQDDEDDDESSAQDDDDESSAQDDDDEASAQDDDDEAKAAAAALASGDAATMAAEALAKVHRLEVNAKTLRVNAKRRKLIASRPDFSPEMVKVLEQAPMATVKRMCAKLPKGPTRTDRVAAAVMATGTQGDAQGVRTPRLSPGLRAELDTAMGLTETKSTVVNSPNRMSFGVQVPIARKASDQR